MYQYMAFIFAARFQLISVEVGYDVELTIMNIFLSGKIVTRLHLIII